MRILDDFKYDWPLLYRISQIILIGLAGLLLMLVIPKTEATAAMGITNLQVRVTSAWDAFYWGYKSKVFDSQKTPDVVKSGYITGLEKDGTLAVSITTESNFATDKLALADIKIIDFPGARKLVSSKMRMKSRIDIYDEEAVVWIEGSSLNVDLVMAGLAEPSKSQKTDIIPSVLAAYFWRKAIGN